jgi:hypothetical protein
MPRKNITNRNEIAVTPKSGKSKERYLLSQKTCDDLQRALKAHESIYRPDADDPTKGRIILKTLRTEAEGKKIDAALLPTSTSSLWNFLKTRSRILEKPTLEFLCLYLLDKTFDEWVDELPDDEKPQREHKGNKQPTREHGLEQVILTPSIHEMVKETLTAATTSAWFFGSTLEQSLDTPPKVFLDALQRGVTLHWLVINPNEKERLRLLAEEVDTTYDDAILAAEATINRLLLLLKRYSLGGDQFDPSKLCVRVTKRPIRMRAYVADPDQPGALGYFIPSINQKKSIHLPVFKCRNTPQGLFSTYFEGLHQEWNSSMTLHSFLGQEGTETYLAKFREFFDSYGEESP